MWGSPFNIRILRCNEVKQKHFGWKQEAMGDIAKK